MEISDLIKVGSLEFSRDSSKKVVLKLRTEFQHILTNNSEFFLIFKDHRVRYVAISVEKIINNNCSYVKILDDDVAEEILLEDNLTICLSQDDINKSNDSDQYFNPIGMKVLWKNQEVAETNLDDGYITVKDLDQFLHI